ncbi:GreA/GreB family elongation factor [Acidimicrobium ferrooxidans DSM 10331]|uniref:Transcription elongation factor GreA n=1 Tax=Acidimicrobium ferrooxidans (strain DSM 10331 / JCM 15462 / NBRC 103882 / ICP) TaxID=525909 RepID=C7M0F0_ACIFD|nr:transcription elongation factor GreA [Acidimicrobium ferrooxidans]ACU54458.1 GreA/GreB family elongation factor [Acidimicrobium ferrooxidans DSM 10331]
MSEVEISQATYDALVQELEELTTQGRIEIAKAIEAARALGDLSENGDYHAAKDAQGKMEARIRQIQQILQSARVVSADLPTDEVRPGVVVGLRYEGEDDVEHYLVGSIEERHPGLEVVSPTSPLGEALLGARVGAWVEYEAPRGTLKVQVVEIGPLKTAR